MGDVFRFPQPSGRGGQVAAAALDRAAFRAELEAAAREALDTADRIIAALDRFDGDLGLGGSGSNPDPVVCFRPAQPDAGIVSPDQR